MRRTYSYSVQIGVATLLSMSLAFFCNAQTVAKPLVFDTEQSGAASELGQGWNLRIHREPSQASPLIRLSTVDYSKYRYDLMRAITRNPGIVEVLQDLDVASIHMKKSEQFESSDSAMLLAHDGSDCVARIHGVTLYPECLWLSGFNPELREGKFEFVKPSGKTEVWYRIVDSKGKVIGWRLQDWQFDSD